MGFLSGIGEKIFGGNDSRGQDAQIEANARYEQYIREQAALARGDASNLYNYADDARNQSYNMALEMLGGAMPEQARLFQDGNYMAQQQLSMGAPQYQNAIMGLPVQQAQPMNVQMPDFSQYQVQLPDFGQRPDLTPAPPQQQQQQDGRYIPIMNFLGGLG